MTAYGRDTFAKIASYLASDHPEIANALRQHDEDSHALEDLLVRLEEVGVIVGRVAREAPATVVRLLQSLPAAPKRQPPGWFEYFQARTEGLRGDSVMELLIGLVGELSLENGTALIEIDTLGDDYAITFLPIESARRFIDIAPGYLKQSRLDKDASVRFMTAKEPGLRTEVSYGYKITRLDDSDHALDVLQEVDDVYARMLPGWWISGTIDTVDGGDWAIFGDTEGVLLPVIDFERWQHLLTDELRTVVAPLAPRAQISIEWNQDGSR